MTFRKINCSCMAFIIPLFLTSCATGPSYGPIKDSHREIIKSARSVYLDITARDHWKEKLPIDIDNDSIIILKTAGLDISPEKEKADLFIKIFAEGKHINAMYDLKQKPGMMKMPPSRYPAGSEIFGHILFSIKDKGSYIRNFYGKAEPPKTVKNINQLGIRYWEAYEKSNFVKAFASLLTEIYGAQIDAQINTALETARKGKKEDATSSLLKIIVQQTKINKKNIDKIKAYEIGILSEEQFFNDGWNTEKPIEGILGIVEFTKNLDGYNEYTLGYYIPPSSLKPGPLTEFNKKASDHRSSMKISWSANYQGLERITICKLGFSKGILTTKKCN